MSTHAAIFQVYQRTKDNQRSYKEASQRVHFINQMTPPNQVKSQKKKVNVA